MAVSFQQMLCRTVQSKILNNHGFINKNFQRNISFNSFSYKIGSIKFQKIRYIKIVASIVGVSSVFVTKTLLNSTAAKSQSTTQKIEGARDIRDLNLTLYQFQSCPFCCKVRATLDYYGFSYKVVEVNSVTKAQLKFSDYKKVPVLVAESENGEEFVSLMDSSVITSILVSHLYDPSTKLSTLKTYYPALEETVRRRKKLEFPNRHFIMYGESISDDLMKKQKEERKWRAWVDDDLVHMISPNVYRTPSESLEAFHHFSDWGQWEKHFSSLNRLLVIYVGAPVMYIIGKFIKRKYKLHDDVRYSLYQSCDVWMRAVGKRKYLGGDEPCVADLSVYGVLSSFEGCQAFTDLMANSKIKPWYYRMKKDIQEHRGASLNLSQARASGK